MASPSPVADEHAGPRADPHGLLASDGCAADDRDPADYDAYVARMLSDAELAAVVDDWAAYHAAVLADTTPPDDGYDSYDSDPSYDSYDSYDSDPSYDNDDIATARDDIAHRTVVDRGAGAGAGAVPGARSSARALLERCASSPVLARAALLDRIAAATLTEWEADELVRQAACLQAAVTALQVKARLAMAASYGRLRERAQARQDARDAAARAEGEAVPARPPVRDQSVSALMKLENVSRAAAEGRLAQAADYVTRTPRLFALLEQGSISPDVLRMVRSETATLDRTACHSVEERILGELDRTPGEVARKARQAAAAIDPEAFGSRTGAARHSRHAYAKPLPDGMALLSVIGPAEHVALRWLEIDEHAHALVAAGDPRTLAQLRCDLLLDSPPPPDGCKLADPIVGSTCLDLGTGEVATATWTQPTETATPGAPCDASSDEGEPSSGAPPARRSTRRRTFQGRPVATVLVMHLATFLGGDDLPALIQGVGPIPAAVARELAHGSQTWFRAAVDDSGTCRDYGRLRAPRQDLRDLTIRGRGVLCACGCGQPAAQIDHTIEHRDGGTTSEDNLNGLATRCHTDKTDAVTHGTGWIPTPLGDGSVLWTSPFGHERRVRPADIGLAPPSRGRTYDARELEPPPPPRVHDPTKPFHPILNPLPPTPRDATPLPADGSPPF